MLLVFFCKRKLVQRTEVCHIDFMFLLKINFFQDQPSVAVEGISVNVSSGVFRFACLVKMDEKAGRRVYSYVIYLYAKC